MTYENFTLASQNSLKKATQIARAEKHKFIETGHLLKGILLMDKSILPFLFRRLDIDIQDFEEKLDTLIVNYPPLIKGKLNVSLGVEKSLKLAKRFSKGLKEEFISIEHLIYGVLEEGGLVAGLLKLLGFTEEKLQKAIQTLREGTELSTTNSEDYPYLYRYATDINKQVEDGAIDPVIGRTEEIRRILQILSRRRKNNPMVLGEPGVGKTAVVEGLAQRIVQGDIPDNLKNNRIFSLDMGLLIAGASKQGEFEKRLKSVIKEVKNSGGEIILFIDEIHILVGAGKSSGAMDAANILKPALARGELKAIGATTLSEYQKYIEKDRALERRFQKVIIEEPDIESTVSILRGIKKKYEAHHHVRIQDDALIAAAQLSARYITGRFLPDKAIDLIDESAAKLRLEMNSLPEEIDTLEREIRRLKTEREAIRQEDDEEKLAALSQKITNLSENRSKLRATWESEKGMISTIIKTKTEIEQLKAKAKKAEKESDFERVAKIRYKELEEAQSKLKKLQSDLAESEIVLFKEEIDKDLIAEIVSDITGIPLERMMKSERKRLMNLENELGKRVIGQRDAIRAVSSAVRRSRAGLHDAKKPIGSFIFLGTTGVGKTELAKALASYLFDNETSIVRVDMSEYQEKHAVSRLIGSPPGYVGYDAGGQLTEAVRKKPYSIVLFDEIEKAHKDVFNTLLQVLDDGRLTDGKGRTVNFKNTIIIMTSNAGADKITEQFEKLTKNNRPQIIAKAKAEVSQILKKNMSPEFLNRIDEIVMFTPLSLYEIQKITELQVNGLIKKVAKNDIELCLSKLAVSWLARVSYNPQFGARPVKRSIQRYILNEMSEQIIGGKLEKEKIMCVDYEAGKLVFKNISEDEKLKINSRKDTEQKTDKNVTAEKAKAKTETEKMNFWDKFVHFFKNLFSKNKTNESN